jgi:hypothetical protein
MGHGRVPNRTEDLARPRERKGGDVQPITKGLSRPANIPPPDESWHPIALMLWNAVLESGQCDFYESSDYAFLFSVCEDLSVYKRMPRRNGNVLTAIYGAFERLLVTEGDRRRLRIELEDPQPTENEAVVTQMEAYRNGLRGKRAM